MLRTKEQQKEICSDCPIAKAAHLMGDTCTLLIVRDLLSQPKRFKEITASLSGISSRTITNKLKLLETQGVIKKETFAEKPRRVEYSLTKKGEALHKVLDKMRQYGEEYL